MELKSLSQRIECVKLESWSLRMFLVSLVWSSMRLGGLFIAPRQLGAIGGQSRKAKVAFCRVAHWTVTVDGPVPISFLFWRRRPLQLRGSWHTGLSGAPCRLLARATRRPRIARPNVALAIVGSPDSPVHHRTVR
jgi:hypothetical protein